MLRLVPKDVPATSESHFPECWKCEFHGCKGNVRLLKPDDVDGGIESRDDCPYVQAENHQIEIDKEEMAQHEAFRRRRRDFTVGVIDETATEKVAEMECKQCH